MDGSGGILSVDHTGESHPCTSSDDSLSVDGSSCSTVVTDSVDSDSTPSPVLLGGLRLLQRRECVMQNKSKYSHAKEYDESESTEDSESILDPTKRLKGLILKETGRKRANVQAMTDDSRTESSVKCVGSPGSEKVDQTYCNEDKVADEDPSSTIPNLSQNSRVHLASRNHNVLSDSHATPSTEGIGRNLHDIHRPIDESYSEGNPGGEIEIMDDIRVHRSCTGCDTIVLLAGGSYHKSSSSSDLGRFQDNLGRSEKIRKLLGNSEQVFHSYDSNEEVTQVDGSALMFSDSSPVRSPLANVLLPYAIGSDIDMSGEQQTVECKSKTSIHQETCESYDISFDECQDGNISSAQFSSQLQWETSHIAHISTPTESSTRSSGHLIHKDNVKCNESIISVGKTKKEDATVASCSLDKFPTVCTMETEEAQAIHTYLGNVNSAGTADGLLLNRRSSNSEVMLGVGRGGKKKAAKRGKGGKRSSKTIDQKGRVSENARSLDEVHEVTKRSMRINAGINRSDALIHDRILELQGKVTRVKSSQDRLTESLTKPEKVLKDAAVLGQQLSTHQTNLRRIAADLKKAKNNLERSLFDLRFVYSQKKRKIYVEQELKLVTEIQQTLLTRLKVHRQIASKLQDIIRRHSKEVKDTRRKVAKQILEQKGDKEEPLGMTSGDGSTGHSSENVSDKGATCTATETISGEKQNTLLQQLLESLDDGDGNLLVKFMSMLQNKGNEKLQSSDATKALPSPNTGDTEERKSVTMKNISLESSLGSGGISANMLTPAEVEEIFEDRHDLLIKSSQKKDSTLYKNSKILDSDMDNTPDEIEDSSSGDCSVKSLSSSGDEMSVEPDSFRELHQAPNIIVPKSNCSLEKMKQVTSIGQIFPEMVKASEKVMNTFPNVQSSGSSYQCPVPSDEFGSVITIQKNVQSSMEQVCNVVSSKQINAHFHTPWKDLDSNVQRSSSEVQFKQVTSFHSSMSVAMEMPEGYKPTGKSQLGSIPNISPSENTKHSFVFQQKTAISEEGKELPYNRQRLSTPVGCLLQNTRTNTSTLPENIFDCEYSHNSHVDSDTKNAASDSYFKGKAVVLGDTAIQRKSPDICKETLLGCDGKDEPIGLITDKRRWSVLNGSCTKEDVNKQLSDQIHSIPDMKLYDKVHLIEENELVPYTEILPKEMWTTEHISLVEMPQEFIDEIDLW